MRRPTIWTGALVGTIVLLGTLAPFVGAMGFGANTESLDFAKSKGWNPNYTMFWVGPWSKSHWASVDQAIIKARDGGATPLLQWYYWGDSISPNCVKYGCAGRSQGDWNAMGSTLATKIRQHMGNRPVVVVVETEFNKGGIDNWEDFDGILAAHINMLKSKAPNAKFVLGFGSWGQDKYWRFDRAMGAAHMSGFQVMRASTRDSDAATQAVPEHIKQMTVKLKSQFGKPVFMQDLAISTYGGKEWLQEQVIRNILARKGEYEAAGLVAIVYRDVRDNPSMPLNNYYGYGERHFGFFRADGSAKPAWWVWKQGASGGNVALGSTGGPAPAPTQSSGSVAFTGVMAKNWWQQVSVNGATRVDMRINGGGWMAMAKQSWGGWGISKALSAGATVQFQAFTSDGKAHQSPTYRANGDGSVTVTSSAPAPSASVSFTPKVMKDWWQQVKVGGSFSKVEVKVGSGGWVTMTKQSYGDHTSSIKAPWGTSVQFRATTPGGLKYSAIYRSG